MSEEKKLTLHEHHLANGAKFTSFAGWSMPVSYGSSLNEHLTVRQSVGLFDVSHMGEIEVQGEQAEEFLNFALTNDLRKCEIGKAQYTLLCTENGGTLDDLIIYRREQNKFLLCVNASNIERDFKILSDRAAEYNCEVVDLSSHFGQLALQGPMSEKTLSEIIPSDITKLKKMRFIEGSWMGSHAIIARTGYTGEDGFEIYCSVKELKQWAVAFENTQTSWIGLAARDSLRLESGFPLYGHELSLDISPVQAGLSWAVGWSKENFCGGIALSMERKNQPKNHLIYYLADGQRIPRGGCQILDPNDDPAGIVLSGGFSPLHKKPMGTALIKNTSWEIRKNPGWHALIRENKIPIDLGLSALQRITNKK